MTSTSRRCPNGGSLSLLDALGGVTPPPRGLRFRFQVKKGFQVKKVCPAPAKTAGLALSATPDQVVGYVPDRTGAGAATYTFESLDSAEWILSYSGIYPVRDRATVPHAVDGTTHH